MLNIHRILLHKLAAAWLMVSLGIGGGLYIYGLGQIDEQLVALAVKESGKISDDAIGMFSDAQRDSSALERLTEQFLRERFVVVTLYNAHQRQLVQRSNPRYTEIRHTLETRDHRFPMDGLPHYERITLGDDAALEVMVPLRDKARVIVGYIEGIFLLDRDTVRHHNQNLIFWLLITLAAVLLTTVVIYPVVLSLNRSVIKYSHDLLKGNIELMEVLGGAIAQRDSDTNIHNYRVSIYAVHLAEAVGLDREAIHSLIAGAFLHDVGKIGISDNILLKPGRLTEAEFAIMKTHVVHGMEILSKSNWLQTARDVVECHHEKYDGSGYPRGLQGEAIPINARIFSIVDVFDALTSKRPYKEPIPFADTLEILKAGAGSHFDPRILDTFCTIAADLHTDVSSATDAAVEARLQALITRYFFPEQHAV